MADRDQITLWSPQPPPCLLVKQMDCSSLHYSCMAFMVYTHAWCILHEDVSGSHSLARYGVHVVRSEEHGCAEAHAHGLDMEMWEAWYCQDGVTVFFGTNKENRDVLMVSLIVRAPPNLVTEVQSPVSSPLSPVPVPPGVYTCPV